MGALWGASDESMGGIRHPHVIFWQFGEKTRQPITVNQLQILISIHLYWKYVLIIC